MSIPMVMVDSLSREECLALLEISHTINSTLDIQKILNSTLQQLSRVIEASASSIWLLLRSDLKSNSALSAK